MEGFNRVASFLRPRLCLSIHTPTTAPRHTHHVFLSARRGDGDEDLTKPRKMHSTWYADFTIFGVGWQGWGTLAAPSLPLRRGGGEGGGACGPVNAFARQKTPPTLTVSYSPSAKFFFVVLVIVCRQCLWSLSAPQRTVYYFPLEDFTHPLLPVHWQFS